MSEFKPDYTLQKLIDRECVTQYAAPAREISIRSGRGMVQSCAHPASECIFAKGCDKSKQTDNVFRATNLGRIGTSLSSRI